MLDDAAAPVPSPDRAAEADGRMVRRVRWQLITWSAGSTFVILLVLGTVLYGAVATTLASASENLLRDRAALMSGSMSAAPVGAVAVDGTSTTVVGGADAAQPGFAVSGPYSGTLAVLVPGGVPVDVTMSGDAASAGTVVAGGVGAGGAAGSTTTIGNAIPATPSDPAAALAPPDPAGYVDAEAGRTTIHETTYQGSPVRVLSIPAPAVAPGAPAGVIQVIGDRTAEIRTLGVLLAVLLGGGFVALVLAGVAGSLYATRALVPIRASLRRQRELAADTSHELRTPLAVIRAGVARIRQQPDARVSDVEFTLDAVDAEAVRLATIVDDLLALARTDAGTADLDLGPVDLADIAADSLAGLEPLATKRSVRLVLDVEPSPMTGDADRLRRLITALVDNAIRHGREGGTVSVAVRPGSLVVDDDGPGISAADRDRVFDRFYRAAGAAPGGSGLGLPIAAWIVERHGGRIEASVSPTGGARFCVTLPVGPDGFTTL